MVKSLPAMQDMQVQSLGQEDSPRKEMATHSCIPASVQFSSVQSLSCVQFFAIPWTAACQASLSTINSLSLFKLISIKLVMPSNHLILCYPLLLLPSGSFPKSQFFTSGDQSIGVSAHHQSFLNEYSGPISFRIDSFDLLAVQGTLKSLLQHDTSKVWNIPQREEPGRLEYMGSQRVRHNLVTKQQ